MFDQSRFSLSRMETEDEPKIIDSVRFDLIQEERIADLKWRQCPIFMIFLMESSLDLSTS